MKRISLLSAILLLSTAFPLAAQNNCQDEWRYIDSLYHAGQPQSAKQRIERIYEEAKRQQNIPLFIKALLYRIHLNYLRDDNATQGIDDVETLLMAATFPAKNILHSIAADIYWRYYLSNRRQILSRTAIEYSGDSTDVRTWDLRRIVAQCILHYRASLENDIALQKTGIEEYHDILEKHVESEQYRPTLYDLLAFRAAEFYRENESGLVQPADQFRCSDTIYFAPAETFAAATIHTDDSLSFLFQTLSLLQKIIAFHLADTNPIAVVDADLQRLRFVYANTTLPSKDSLYLAALQQLEARYTQLPVAADILFHIAGLYIEQGNAYHPYRNTTTQWKLKDAMTVIDTTIARFPKSLGAQNSRTLKAAIERPALQVSIDEAVEPQTPIPALITYRNISTVYYKIIALDIQEEWKESPFITGDERVAASARRPAIASGKLTLPDDGDYQQHIVEAALPALDIGYYAILLSSDVTFDTSATVITENRIWVTRISCVKRSSEGQTTLLLLDRTTGSPLPNVEARLYRKEYDYNHQRNVVESTGETYMSDADGAIVLTSIDPKYRSRYPLFTLGEDHYADAPIYFGAAPYTMYGYVSTTFFTDRAIYRPGQTVFFKGIVLRWTDGAAEVVKNHRQTVTCYNANNDKISEMTVESNAFGSFAGQFIIPTTGLTGQMSIAADRTAAGRVYFHVEEYRRPTFEVLFSPVARAYRLGEDIMVEGRAVAYAGVGVSGAKVTYRVVRKSHYPLWRRWLGERPASLEQEIASGKTVTDTAGGFTIPFTAIPDEMIDKTLYPVFYYNIIVSVSDMNGETYDTQTVVPAGYRSLMLTTDMPERINTDNHRSITIIASSLNGTSVPTKGTLTVWKLRDPIRILHPRKGERPDRFLLPRAEFERLFPYRIYDNEDSPLAMEREREMYSLDFNTGDTTIYRIPRIERWPAGRYLMTLTAHDDFGEQVEQMTSFYAFSQKRMMQPPQDAFWYHLDTNVVQPGDRLHLIIGSAFRDVQAMVEITGHRGALLDRKTIRLSNGAQRVVLPVDETYRGNVGLTVFFVKHNYIYTRHEIINVPYKNKELQWSFASFRDKLQPGQQEEWRITIKDRNGDAVAAELLASMYDVSLDAFAGHKWQFFPWRTNAGLSVWNTGASFRTGSSNELWFNYPHKTEIVQREYDRLIFLHWFAPPQFRSAAKLSLNAPQENSVGIFYAESGIAKRTGKSADAMVDVADNIGTLLFSDSEIVNGIPTPPAPALPSIQIRTNLQETAFFYPQLSTNEKGETVIRFTVPDALTRWNMQGLAWTTDLKTAYIQKSLITQKELMIFSNPPRFFREGDTLSFTAKISNLSARPLTVTTHLLFFDALTSKPLALIIDKGESSRIATVDAGGNHVQTWRIAIPEGIQAIGYRIMATANVPDVAETTRAVSDGEEQIIPALTDRMLITESLPMFVRGKQHREFTFAKLSGNRSATLRSQAFTVEFTSYPVWNAVLSLPYIMNYSYNCVEQTFSRYYANAVAAHIVRSYPRIKQTFDIWRNYQPSALSSALEKNSELKSILLEETPWVSDARNESESRQQIAALFDNNRINSEQATTWQKLQQAQSPNGGFAWFTGGRDDRYITQHIVSGIGRLYRMHIAIEEATGMLDKAIGYMDTQIAEDYERIRRQSDKAKSDAQKENHLHALTVHYLYARSFFIDTYPIRANALDAFNYFLSQAAGYWTTLDNNYLKGMLALALHRYNDTRTAKSIIRSLDETAIHDKEAGMYWRNEQRGRQWYQSPVEMYALMVEAFDEIDYNRSRIEELQTTLLRHKQTHHWKTTKATADAIYALLLPSSEQLSVEGAAKSPGLSPLLVSNAADRLPVITVGSDTVAETPVEAGTGYFKTAWYGSDIHLNMGRIAVDNPNAGIIWGAAYWQYLEQLKHITSASTGVGIRKQLFVKTNTSSGVILKQITPDAPIKVGDRITVRLEVSIDSDMEYVHLKDMRAAAFEPVNVLSGYRYQGGIGYYESIRDAASHFFIDHLPKGLYIFEYDLNATQEGVFSNGITTLQCMYAPEFSAHTEGIRVEVKNK